MNITELQAQADALAKAMTAKGLPRPEASISVKPFEAPLVYMHWDDPNMTYGRTEITRDEDISVAIDEAFELIASLPSLEDRKREQFLTALGRVIDLGRENGIEVDFINPLTATMKRLSENVITHQRSADAPA